MTKSTAIEKIKVPKALEAPMEKALEMDKFVKNEIYELRRKYELHQKLYISGKARVWEIKNELKRRKNRKECSIFYSTLPKKLLFLNDSELTKKLKTAEKTTATHEKKHLDFKAQWKVAFETKKEITEIKEEIEKIDTFLT